MKRRTLSFLLALAVSLSGLTALAAEPDLTTDYVNTFTESSSNGQAADSLIKTVAGREGNYRLFNQNDVKGSTDAAVVKVGAAGSATDMIDDFDGSKKWNTLMLEPLTESISQYDPTPRAIVGTYVAGKNPGTSPFVYFDKTGLQSGDTLVMSVYVKTAEAGKTTRFNMGLMHSVKTAGLAPTAEYGETGMEVGDQWTKFAGAVTIPEGSNMAGWLDPSNLTYSLYFGYPVPCENPAALYLSTVYAAKAAATDITLSLPETAKQGESVTAQANILNQIGSAAGVKQEVTWYVTNEDRTEILTDSGITVTPGENGAAQITVGDTTATGTYAIVAVANENGAMLKGQKLTVTAKPVSNTVTVGEHGSVTFGTQRYASGTHTVSGLNAGEEVSVTVTPEEGYEVESVTYNGVVLPSDHTSVVIVKDAALTASFKETVKVPTISAPVAGEAIPGSAGSENQYTTRVFYFRTSGINWEAPTYGMYLSANKNGERLALDAKGTVSNGMFGIRIYGAAVEETDYFVQGYVKSGEEEITSGEPVSYSMK